MLPQEIHASFGVVSRSATFLWSHCWAMGPHLALRGEYHGVSQEGVGSFVFLLSCHGILGILACCLSEVRPPFKCDWTPRDFS